MNDGNAQFDPVFGFLTVMDDATGAMLGGLLLLNRRGRPLEFHCTAAVAASRAEEILFGPTLRPHIHCERIGAALLAKATQRISLLAVNQLPSWPIADDTSVPVVLVDPRSPEPAASDEQGDRRPTVPACLDRLDPGQRAATEALLVDLQRYVDLAEPFERIAEAIREAGLLGGQEDNPLANDEDDHDHAA